MLITGGKGGRRSVEVYRANQSTPCVLPDLPDPYFDHTMDGTLVCGGGGGQSTKRSCRRWNDNTGTWDLVTKSLQTCREGHVSWTPEDDSRTFLMGGRQEDTSEIISQYSDDPRKSSSSWSMKYQTA